MSLIRGPEGPNNGSDLDESASDGSGFQPAWSIYGWSQPNLAPQLGTSVSSSSSATEASSTPNTCKEIVILTPFMDMRRILY